MLSNNTKKKILRYGEYDREQKTYILSLPLIGQFGKNSKVQYAELISGDILMKLALDKIKTAISIIGGKYVYLECEDYEGLRMFYERNGFVCFGKRELERDEKLVNRGTHLLQMLKDLSKHE